MPLPVTRTRHIDLRNLSLTAILLPRRHGFPDRRRDTAGLHVPRDSLRQPGFQEKCVTSCGTGIGDGHGAGLGEAGHFEAGRYKLVAPSNFAKSGCLRILRDGLTRFSPPS